MAFEAWMLPGRDGGRLAQAGAALFLVGRAPFLPLYAAGTPWLRTFRWTIAALGLAMVLAAIVWPR